VKSFQRVPLFFCLLSIVSGTALAQPAAPVLVSPTGTVSDTTPLYTWNAVANATDYHLWIDGLSGNLLKQWFPATSVCTGSSCKIEPQLPLAAGQYTWWVQSKAGATPGLWSAGLAFRVTPQGAPPTIATLLSPGGLIPERTPTFRWPAVAAATSYQLWVDGPSGKLFAQWYAASAVCSGSSCSVKPALSLADAAHKWWIQTRNGAGDGPWSAPLEFQVSTFTAPPPAPQVVSPAGAIRDLQPTYVWNVAGDALDYYLWIDGPSGNLYKQWIPASSICSGNTCSARPPLTLSEGAHMFWVQGKNGKGSGAWSLVKNFTVVTLVPPAQPLTESPEGVLYRDLPTYSWKPVSQTDEYYLWINGPSGNVLNQWYPVTGTLCSGTTCSIKAPLPLNNGPHVWWVQPANGAGDGPWSAGKNFTVLKPNALPAVIALISPSGVITDSSPVYSWRAMAETDEYQFWLDGPSGNLLQPWLSASSVCSGATCSFKPALTLSQGTHSFNVRGRNGLGVGGWTTATTFRYSPLATTPGAVTLVSPKGNIDSSLPTYTWNKLASSTDYHLWINGPAGNIHKKWYPSTASLCPGATCSLKPDLPLARATYTWWIQTKNSAGEGLWSQALSMTVQTSDTTAPTVSLGAPAPGAVVSGTISVNATASDNVGVTGVQFLLDGQTVGAEDVSAPFTASWNTTSVSNGSHTLSARAKDAAGNQSTVGAIAVTVQNNDTTPPTVSIAAPASGAVVSGAIFVSANASDNVGIAGVQFRIDGQNLGAEDSQSPYSVTWNTTSVTEGSHIISAVARDAAGNPTSSAPISVTVSRMATPGAGWTQLPNTKLRSVCPPNGFGGSAYEFSGNCWTVTEAWNSAVLDTRRNRLIVWGGGHADYYGNEIYALDLGSWTVSRLTDPGLPIATSGCPEAIAGGSQPNSRHTYDGIAYMENVDRMFVVGGSLTPCGFLGNDTWTFNFGNNTWERRNPTGTIPNKVPGLVTAYDPNTGRVFLHDDHHLYTYDFSTDHYALLSSDGIPDFHMTGVIDPVRKQFIMVGAGLVYAYDIRAGSNYARQILATTGGATVVESAYPGLAYHSPSSKIVGWSGGDTVYSLDPDSKVWTPTSAAGGPGTALANGTYERWAYSPTSNAFVVVNSMSNDAYRFVFPSGDTTPPVVSVTSPGPGQMLADTVGISAAASDNLGVVGVQFKVDGANQGAEDTTPPYSVSWDTSSAGDGAHQVTAVARDAAGNRTTSAVVSVTVNNNGGSQPAPAENTVTIYNTSGLSQTNRPVSIARAFRQGDIPQFAAAGIGSTALLTQTDVKNRWPDGSLKFAIVSFVVPSLAPGGSVTVKFSNQASGNNSGYLTQTQMLDSRFDFDGRTEMTGALSRTVSARAMLSNGHFRYWLQGPIVTAVILEDRTPSRTYDQDFGDGSNALHPIFEAWFYDQANKVDLGYTIENTWTSSDATKGMRDLSYSLTVRSGFSAPAIEFTHPTFKHIGRSRWHKRFWLGADPGAVRVDHNIRYLVSTQAIPHYDTAINIAESLLASRYGAWSISDRTVDGSSAGIGNFEKGLGAAGANDWIGLMSTWDTLYLLTMDDRMREVSIGNADLAGRIPWHFREADNLAGTGNYFDAAGTVDTFGRTISINARKTLSLWDPLNRCGSLYVEDEINTGTTDGEGWTTTLDHMPDLAYIPYLMTGRYYYLEEIQYQASFIAAHKSGCYFEPWMRQGEAGYLFDQVRGSAWGFRTLAYAAFISPDGFPEKAYYEDKLKNNVAVWEGERDVPLSYAAKQSNWTWGNENRRDPSPLGVWQDRGAGFIQDTVRNDGYLSGAASPWEENFLLCSFGMARQFGYSTDNLLRYMARLRFHNLLDPSSNKYLVETYRIPTKLAATQDWIQTWPEYTAGFSPIPTQWKIDGTADHGYGFIALAAMSFLNSFTVDGYSGQEAWALFKSEKPGQDRFATESPKWAILP